MNTFDDLLARNHFFMQMRKLAELPRSSDYQEENYLCSRSLARIWRNMYLR